MVPVLFIILLGVLKSTTTTVAVPSGWSDTTSSTGDAAIGTSYNLFQPTGQTIEWVNADLPKFALHESSMTGLILKLGVQSVDDAIRLEELSTADQATCSSGVIASGLVETDTASPYRVPSECADKVSPYKIAVAPDNAFTRNYFAATMDLWYPRLELLNSSSESLTVPSFSESVMFFDDNDALTEYVKSDDYGKGIANPRIYAGIVFDSVPLGDKIGSFESIEYSLRLNSTEGDSAGRVPGTSSSVLDTDPFQTDIDTEYYSRYTVTGFMTLQTLVTRFVSCMPEWNSANQSTTGVCQRSQTTAISSTSLDNTLLDSLTDDGFIQEVLNTGVVSGESSFSSILATMSNDTKEQLLTPLRQAPQPFMGATVAPFPVNSFDSSSFYETISNVFPVIFALSYLFTISRILVVFIQEKELRLREFMKILGVTEKTIILTWYMTYTTILFCGAVVQALAGLAGLFPKTSVILTFFFFWLFGMSVLALAYLISTIFNKARVGSFVGMVVFFFMHVMSQAFTTGTAEGAKTIGCLLSPVGLSLGVQVLADAETTGAGVTFANVSALSNNFRFSTALWMFAFDTVLYTIIGLYFDKVMPKEYGTTLPWYFPLSPTYWRTRRQRPVTVQTQDALLDDVALDVNPNIERVNAELREQERQGDALTVQRLRKVFAVPGGEKVAVQGLNLTMYKDQITCLLGHNGAGKTTLISMLTGMTAPTTGNATYRGMSVNEDMDELRQSLGICFQHDVLFPDLSVEEHLLFFGQIKGYADQELLSVAEKQIREVGLTEKRNSKPNDLSGGMKRKLSVAVSLLGDSSLVFLDEPTSGMDPYSRRSTWEILLNNRNDRVMVLTTHFMDEADILGDRIAIMAEGELRCCGSSLFLKNRFGAGYNLTLVKDDAKCDDKAVSAFVTSFVPSAQLLSNVGSEIAFQLPLHSSSSFATMFAEMDRQLKTLGLLSYGVSVTTLEEVFIKVAELGDENNQHTLGNNVRMNNSESSEYQPCDEIITSTPLFRTHLRALLLKRFRYARRDKKTIIYTALLPVLLIAAGLGILKGSAIASDNPTMALSTDAYSADETPTPYFCQASSGTGDWCSEVMTTSYFSGASAQGLSISEPAFDSDAPTVFDVTYTDPAINASGYTGYSVAMGQQLYNRGYGNGVDLVEGQYGAYLVHGDNDQNLFGYNIFTNTSAPHSSAIFKALMDQAMYRFFAANTSSDSTSDVNLKVNNYPLPVTAATKAFSGSAIAFVSCMFICIAFTFLPASIVVFLVKEKQMEHNSKHQQLVSGVSLPAFWVSNYLWDLTMYIFPCVCALALIYGFNVSSLTGQDCNSCTSATFPAVILLFILFGVAICPFTYCLSFLFKEHAAAQTYTIMINFVIGVVLMIVSFIMSVIGSTSDVDSVLVFIWRLSPLFNLGMGLLQLTLNDITYIRYTKDEKTSPFSGDIMGFELAYLLVTAIVYMVLAVYLDYSKTFPKVKNEIAGIDDSTLAIDEDVKKEADRVVYRVANGGADGDAVKLMGLRKVYPGGKVAVRDLSFGLQRGECFGFLGINGAGKTTTMKMLTGDVPPSSGTATLGGFNILNEQIEVRRQIGYCPQFDALFDLLTVREHLELFGAIKGVPLSSLDRVVMEKIQQLNLGDFENKLAGSLSGGNKRKLSVAIAMIGNPAIIFLDEPSTGMDPVSRRFMWDVIADISTRGKESTIVLTTHSMEECEALCSRVGIMVGGRLRCYGSVQHLKSRFGDGLMFDVKLDTPTTDELEYLLQHVFGDGNKYVTPMELESKCHAFGNVNLAERITASHPTGYSLAAAIERDGFIRAEAFCSWCVEETRFDALNDYLVSAFGPDGVLVMERQNDFCRFKIRGSHNEVKLSKMFALVENVKTEMHIREYSVSQTTLEQIFNSFASQQEEEKGVARGVFQP
ncbi:ABC transporter [Phytophthora megakarya]|uniref:ABC transporter n=1 Tax=Phytophthora megakarya TaxID=4795 RepID=A0A225VXZ5_9STRA|nr:ABC transporter [Phytophthora megakarya]